MDHTTINLDVGYDLFRKHWPEDFNLITHHPRPLTVTTSHIILTKKRDNNKHLLKLFNRGFKEAERKRKVS